MRPDVDGGLSRRGWLGEAIRWTSLGGIAGSVAGGAGAPAADVAPAATVANETPAASPAATADWPDFRRGDDLHGVAATTLPDAPQLKWELEAADGCKSTPAIVGDRVYIAELSGYLRAVDLASGKVQWSYPTLEVQNAKTFIPGFSSPVTVAGDVVLCGDEEGILHCVDRQSGASRWKFNAEGLIVGGATVRGERVIVGSHSQFLYGIQLKSGEKLWEFDAQGPVNGTQAFDGDLTFVTGCSEPVLYVVDTRTGEEHSRVPLEDLLIASPALADGILYFGTSEGLVLAVDWQAKRTVWKFETQQPREIHSAPALTADSVVIGARDKALYCLNRQTGEKRWAFKTRAGNDNSPVVVGSKVYFGSGDKFAYGINLADGQAAWKYNAGVSFSEASPAAAQGRLVLCTEGSGGRILCFG